MSQNLIKATKGSGATLQETTFTQTAWNLLGKNKEGWEIVRELPSEVKAAKAKADTEKEKSK